MPQLETNIVLIQYVLIFSIGLNGLFFNCLCYLFIFVSCMLCSFLFLFISLLNPSLYIKNCISEQSFRLTVLSKFYVTFSTLL